MRVNSPDAAGPGRPRRGPFTSRRKPPSARSEARPAATAACGLGGADVAIGMPSAFAAFCVRHLDIYTRYVAVRMKDGGQAEALAQAALGDLAMMWAEALQSPSPSALAWRLLAARTGRAAAGGGMELYRVLPVAQADAVLLRYRLGLSAAEAAEVMGWEPGEFACLLKAAVRTGAAR